MGCAKIANKKKGGLVLRNMRFLWIFLFVGAVWAKAPEATQVLVLPKGPVRDILKKNYRIHLQRNLTEQANQEIEKMEKKLSKKHGS